MQLFRALQNRDVRRIWGGQVFSAIGDEIYNIALIWYATSLLGLGAGYLASVQAGASFVASVFGGVLADHRDHRHVMIFADSARAAVVALLPLVACFTPLTVGWLVPVAILVAALSAFFSPALGAFLPQLIEDRPLLRATNGLMETTARFARVIGPGLVGLLSAVVPPIQYFTIDAVSFLVSAFSISTVKPHVRPPEEPALSIRETLLAGHRLTCKDRLVAYTIFSGAIAGGTWIFMMPLGLTLLLKLQGAATVGALGYLIASYGFGNITSNLIIANIDCKRPAHWIFAGRVIAGVSFIGASLASTPRELMAAAGCAAVGGPMTDLGFVNLIQSHFRGRDVARTFRYLNALSYGCLLIVFLTSPALFAAYSVPTVVLANAVILLFTGAFGYLIKESTKQIK